VKSIGLKNRLHKIYHSKLLFFCNFQTTHSVIALASAVKVCMDIKMYSKECGAALK
jgi:hypothetical protein